MDKEWIDSDTVKEVILTEVTHVIPEIENKLVFWRERKLEAENNIAELETKLAELLSVKNRPTKELPAVNQE